MLTILSIIYILLGITILEIYNINKGLNTDIYTVKDIPVYIATMMLWPVVVVVTLILVVKSLIRNIIHNIVDTLT